MLDTQIHVGIASYKRAGRVTTLDLAPFAYVWVPESQGPAYEEHYPGRVITIPDSEDGNTGRKRNAILNRTPCPWTLILDDDITAMGAWDDGREIRLAGQSLWEVIVQGFILAADVGVHLWGVNQLRDPMCYRTYTPVSLLAPILGPFTGHLEPVVRYDEEIPSKEDYDFWLQTIRADHRTLRLNKYHYTHDHGKAPGGFVALRTMERERLDSERMVRKWGSKVYRRGGTSGGKAAKGENILNNKVRVPIPGT